MVDLEALDPLILAIVESAIRLDRENLDATKERTQVCDHDNDDVLRQNLYDQQITLSCAIAAAGLTI